MANKVYFSISILYLNTSGANEIPNGSLFHLYLPNGLLNFVNMDEFLFRSTCQNQFLHQNLRTI